MDTSQHPCRSVLYIPGSNDRALEKAKGLPADAIIFDLEDAVAPAEKSSARNNLANKFAQGGYGERLLLVRINGFDTPWGEDDLAAFDNAGADGILLPKMTNRAHADAFSGKMDAFPGYANTAIWGMIENPEGVLNVADIARTPRMGGLVMGTNDLASDLRVVRAPDRGEMLFALQATILAARAAGIIAIDGVYNALRDEAGLVRECIQGRAFGFDGKSLIHPSQVGPTNSAFSPTDDELGLARRQIAAFEEAEATGQGVAVLDGKIVENLHVATARRIIAIDAAIRAKET